MKDDESLAAHCVPRAGKARRTPQITHESTIPKERPACLLDAKSESGCGIGRGLHKATRCLLLSDPAMMEPSTFTPKAAGNTTLREHSAQLVN